jgi:pre-mRNA-splicing factor CWC22
VFERIRGILSDATIDKRVQYMIDVLFAVRKDKFKVQSWPFNKCFG